MLIALNASKGQTLLQLRSHIPIAAPARREAADGAESPLRLVLGFEPRWFHTRCGVDLGEQWHRDPHYRRATLVRMRAALRASFPSAAQWDGNEERDVCTIGGCFGVGVIPAAFGMPLRYSPDRWPVLQPGHLLTDSQVEALTAEGVLSSPFVDQLLQQVEAMTVKWGTVYGDLNWQGVLNNAFHLRGDQIFLDLMDRPEFAGHLFAVITEVIVRLAQIVQERQRRSGFDIDYMCVSNCTVSMVSPATYERMLLPFDARIGQAFKRFGVHTCNWDVSAYLDALNRLPRLGYLDMGSQSDLRRVRRMFPETRRAVLITPGKLQAENESEMVDELARIRRDLSPCDVVLADIPWDTADQKVEFVLKTCRELEQCDDGAGAAHV